MNVQHPQAVKHIGRRTARGSGLPTAAKFYVVVRIADEFVVDLLKAACGIEFEEARGLVEETEIEGVRIPFASPELLWRTKQTVASKDELDRLFLAKLIDAGRGA